MNPTYTLSDTGRFTREFALVGRKSEVRGVIKDDFHHFRVALAHDGERVTAVSSHAIRYPLSLCPAARAQLDALVGAPLGDRIAHLYRWTDPLQQCTHQMDLAALAVAAAARGTTRRDYRITVTDPVDGRQLAILERDGIEATRWELSRGTIVAPPELAGRSLGRGFTALTMDLDAEEAEALMVLRRGAFLSGGRRLYRKGVPQGPTKLRGGCWVQQPERVEIAERMQDFVRDWSDADRLIDEDDEAWLSGSGLPVP